MQKYTNMSLYLTLDCNLGCTYCFCGKKYKEVMNEETAFKAVDYFMSIATDNPVITFFGGEPLLKSKLIEKVCNYCSEKYSKEVIYCMTTNGTLLTKENVELIKKNNINILISIDGLKDSHDTHRKFTNGKGSWDTIMNNIENNLKFKPPVRITFTKDTVYKLSDNVIGLHKMGFDNVAFYQADGELFSKDNMETFKKQFDIISEYYYNCFKNNKPISSHWIDKSIIFGIRQKVEYCKPGYNQFSVTPNGELYPCCRTDFSDKSSCIGTLEIGIDEEKVQKIAVNLGRIDPDCEDCDLKNRCSLCPIDMYAQTGEYYKMTDWYCEMNQYAIISSDRIANRLYMEKNELFKNIFYNGNEIYSN